MESAQKSQSWNLKLDFMENHSFCTGFKMCPNDKDASQVRTPNFGQHQEIECISLPCVWMFNRMYGDKFLFLMRKLYGWSNEDIKKICSTPLSFGKYQHLMRILSSGASALEMLSVILRFWYFFWPKNGYFAVQTFGKSPMMEINFLQLLPHKIQLFYQ